MWMRWQQFTGPIMKKGIEDTALYVYYPLSFKLNEVGGNPEAVQGLQLAGNASSNLSGTGIKRWPDSLNATSTHDTKLSEDVRARLNALSEIPDEWAEEIANWSKRNESHKLAVDDRKVPLIPMKNI